MKKSLPAVDGYVSKAALRNVRVSPRKARLVVDLVRGCQVETALNILNLADKKTAPLLRKLLLSAVANAKERSGINVDELYIKQAWVDGGKILYRFLPRAHGRATKLRKRQSTITVILDEC